MRLLIVSPAAAPASWGGGRTLSPPMALPVLASLTPDDVDIRLVDEHVDEIDWNEEVDLVALSFMTAAAPRAYQVADRFRERGVPVVLGGMHPTALPEEGARHADAVVVGEAELQWGTVLSDFAAGRLKQFYQADARPDLRGLPIPRRDLLKTDRYLVPNLVQTTRGCPYACTFCSVTPVFGRQYRFRPVDEVVDEVASLGSRSVGFIDDNIVALPRRAKELFEALIPLKLQWVGQGDLSMAEDPEMLTLMRRSGCLAMFIGIESISQDSLVASHKRPMIGVDAEAAIRTIHRHGIDIVGSFVFGLDPDTVESCHATVEFALKMKLAATQLNVLTPYPGTPVYDQLLAEGRITSRDWSRYTMAHVVFRPLGMTAEELSEVLVYARRRFYSWPSIVRRMLVWRGGRPKFVLRAAANISYRRHHRGKTIWSSLPHDGLIAPAPAPVPAERA